MFVCGGQIREVNESFCENSFNVSNGSRNNIAQCYTFFMLTFSYLIFYMLCDIFGGCLGLIE